MTVQAIGSKSVNISRRDMNNYTITTTDSAIFLNGEEIKSEAILLCVIRIFLQLLKLLTQLFPSDQGIISFFFKQASESREVQYQFTKLEYDTTLVQHNNAQIKEPQSVQSMLKEKEQKSQLHEFSKEIIMQVEEDAAEEKQIDAALKSFQNRKRKKEENINRQEEQLLVQFEHEKPPASKRLRYPQLLVAEPSTSSTSVLEQFVFTAPARASAEHLQNNDKVGGIVVKRSSVPDGHLLSGSVANKELKEFISVSGANGFDGRHGRNGNNGSRGTQYVCCFCTSFFHNIFFFQTKKR